MGFGHKQRRRLPLVTVGCPPAAVTNGSSKSSALVLSRIDACTKPRRLASSLPPSARSWQQLAGFYPRCLARKPRWRPTRHSGPLPVRPRVTSSLRARSRTVPWLLLFVRFCFLLLRRALLYLGRITYATGFTLTAAMSRDLRRCTRVIPSKCTRNWASVSNIGYHGSTH